MSQSQTRLGIQDTIYNVSIDIRITNIVHDSNGDINGLDSSLITIFSLLVVYHLHRHFTLGHIIPAYHNNRYTLACVYVL